MRQLVETQPVQTASGRHGLGCPALFLVAVLLLALGAAAFFAAWMAAESMLRPYQDRIYPHVYVAGIDLGGLTPAEAAARLADAPLWQERVLILRDGERRWAVPWAEIGLHVEPEATAQAAFAVGRGETNPLARLRLLAGDHEVSPVMTLDPQAARELLGRLAEEVYDPPENATLQLVDGQVVAVPGRSGRGLNIEATLDNLVTTVNYLGPDNQVALTFLVVLPDIADASSAQAEAEAMLTRQIELSAYDVLTDESFHWTLGRDELFSWLRVTEEDGPRVVVDPAAVQATLANLAAGLGEGRGFRLQEATEQVMALFAAGGGATELYLTHPTRTHIVQPGDTVTRIAAAYGMPPGLIAEANPNIDLNRLQVGQTLTIPSQDVLTPYIPDPSRRIVVSIAGQRMRVYQDGMLLYDWPVSTGIARSPTYTGIYQVLSKEENAYASQWDLWMPHFIAVYRAGGDVYNGIHALPILSSGRRLWEGALGSPASYGCIILGVEEAATLYEWVDIGVLVVIE